MVCFYFCTVLHLHIITEVLLMEFKVSLGQKEVASIYSLNKEMLMKLLPCARHLSQQ